MFSKQVLSGNLHKIQLGFELNIHYFIETR